MPQIDKITSRRELSAVKPNPIITEANMNGFAREDSNWQLEHTNWDERKTN